MKIRLYDDLPAMLRRRINCYLSANPEPRWWEILDKVSGETLDVDTSYLFQDQFNTSPITGVSYSGIRCMAWMVAEVIDDIRPDYFRCNWCGKPSHYSTVHSDTCPQCSTRGYMERFTKDINLVRTKAGTSYILAVP